MIIEVEVANEDIARFQTEYGFSRNWVGKALIILLIDLIACGYLQMFFLPMFVFTLVLFPFFFVIPYYSARAKLKRAFENNPSALGRKVYKPFASGIEITSEKGDDFLRYETIRQVDKTRNYVFILLSSGSYYLLPKWGFSSSSEIDRFLQLGRNGMGAIRGVKVREPLTFKLIYLVGVICLIPLIGAIAGVVFIILGIAHYRDRVFIIIGAVGIVITVAVYGSLFYISQDSTLFRNGFAEIAQTQINDLVKNIEFYKMQHSEYPDSLQQLVDKNSMISIYDVSQATATGKDLPPYHYKKVGKKYLLFSPGIDGIVDTKDDIYPTLTNPDTSRLGFIRKK